MIIRIMGKATSWSGVAPGRPGRYDREHLDADVLVWFEACRIAMRTAIESEGWASHSQWATG